jgi:outer membrane protein OmpA-like peptidoglycan-associated protein
MRKTGWTTLLAATLVLPAPVAAQQGATRSVDDYVCTFTDECSDQATQADEADRGAPRVSSTRGFSLARPRANSTSAAPATGTAASQASRPAARPAPRTQTATAKRPSAAPAATQGARQPRRRADLRLSFDLGSAMLTPQAREEARVFAQALQTPQLSSRKFVIEGHTDSIGGRAYNLDLSRRRAEAVVDYLTSLGVARSRLQVRGYGFDQPLDGRSAASADNRRVEAVLGS